MAHNFSSLPKKPDYCVPKLNCNKVYEVMIPSREDSKRRSHRIADTINIFTDGSKLNIQVEGREYIQQKWEYTKASDYQTIVVCIKRKSLPYIAKIKPNMRVINLFPDSQAALNSCIGFVCS